MFVGIFDDTSDTDEFLEIQVQDTLYFVFLHELGHALIDLHSLPITGMEEDAADQLSTLLLLNEEKKSGAIGSVASWFYLSGEERLQTGNLAFWDEHSFDTQRYYNVLCFTYGYDSEKYQELVDYGYLPEERAQRCQYEFARALDSWNTILSPHYK